MWAVEKIILLDISKSTYTEYIFRTRKVEIIRDLKFVEFGENYDSPQTYLCNGTPFHFLDMLLVDISPYSIPSPHSVITLIEGSAQNKTPQEPDYKERESEISSTPDSDPETPPHWWSREGNAAKRYLIIAQHISMSIVFQGVIRELLSY